MPCVRYSDTPKFSSVVTVIPHSSSFVTLHKHTIHSEILHFHVSVFFFYTGSNHNENNPFLPPTVSQSQALKPLGVVFHYLFPAGFDIMKNAPFEIIFSSACARFGNRTDGPQC